MRMPAHDLYMEGFNAYCNDSQEPEDFIRRRGWNAAAHLHLTYQHKSIEFLTKKMTVKQYAQPSSEELEMQPTIYRTPLYEDDGDVLRARPRR